MRHPATAATPRELFQVLQLLNEANVPGDDVVDQVRNVIAENARLTALLAFRERETAYDHLLASLDEDRSETLFLLADAAQDCGRPEEAPGWFWLGEKRKWPFRSTRKWFWDEERIEGGVGNISYRLPHSLCIQVGAIGQLTPHASEREALQAVVNVIASGKWKPEKKR
jgi:hypothetical protein